jgi:hypothetical protein
VVNGAAAGRRFVLSEDVSATRTTQLSDAWSASMDGSLGLRQVRYDSQLRLHAEHGDVGTRAGVDLTSRWWPRWQVVRLDVSLSTWWVRDAQRPERDVASLAVMAGALVRLGRVADVQVNVEDDINRIVGHRVRAVVALNLRVPY